VLVCIVAFRLFNRVGKSFVHILIHAFVFYRKQNFKDQQIINYLKIMWCLLCESGLGSMMQVMVAVPVMKSWAVMN